MDTDEFRMRANSVRRQLDYGHREAPRPPEQEIKRIASHGQQVVVFVRETAYENRWSIRFAVRDHDGHVIPNASLLIRSGALPDFIAGLCDVAEDLAKRVSLTHRQAQAHVNDAGGAGGG